jgi:hypothetical protein
MEIEISKKGEAARIHFICGDLTSDKMIDKPVELRINYNGACCLQLV